MGLFASAAEARVFVRANPRARWAIVAFDDGRLGVAALSAARVPRSGERRHRAFLRWRRWRAARA